MRFVSFSTATDTDRRLGLVLPPASDQQPQRPHHIDTVLDLVRALEDAVEVPHTLTDYIAAGPALHERVRDAVREHGPWAPDLLHHAEEIVLHAPLRPGKVVGVGLNYVEHVEESSRSLDTDRELPTRPVLFSKPATAVIGTGEPILHNARMTAQLDWECELAVIIGAPARSATEDTAMGHVFGYSILNDISARDQRRSGQWFFSKGQDSYAPLGPVVVTADEIPDPHALQLSLTVNDEQRQNGNSRHMLFRIPQLIADISSGVTLESGDVIATGSPQGVGAAMNPPRFLQPGDVVAATIESIGTLTNPVKAV